MAECCITPVGYLKEIGKSIFTQCLWPPIKSHIDYWWCFDNNIQVLRDGVRDLERETFDINQRIDEARLRTENLRPRVEEWSKAGTEMLVDARIILQDDINPKAWNLSSRYSMGKRAKKAAEEIAKHRNDGNFNAISDPAHPPAMGSTSYRQILEFKSRKKIEEEIIESLRSSTFGLIGICGMGGVGKTTMAQRIRERVMEEKLFDEAVMVVVSKPIDILKIQKEIAEWLGLEFDVESMPVRAHKLRTRLMDTKRKIIIFDDVWESLKFEDLGIPFECDFERCKVLLTSRSTDTCKGIKNKKVFELEILEEEEAWILFKEKAGDCVENSALLSVVKDVVAECKGLPIALVTVGTALQDEMDKYKWKDSLSQLRRSNPTDFEEVLAHVYNPLKLSYDYLANDSQRELFLLCCLFPEDYDISIELLTLYSMGLQLFDGISSIEEARNRTHGLVKKLKSRFLLIDGWQDLHVKMHDVVRDVAIYIGSKEKNLKSLNKTSIESSSDAKCNWMSVDISSERMEIPLALRFPKLRLLMLLKLGNNEFSNISFQGMEDLNVLSFPSTWFGSLPLTLGLLKNLVMLCLFNCEVENISFIGELTSLEIFTCNECKGIMELPAEIGRLNRLRLLELNRCYNIRRIPFGILSSLVRLEELKMRESFDGWEAEENGKETKNASLTELESLPNLTCLEIEISNSNLAAQQFCLPPKLVKYWIRIANIDGWYVEGENLIESNDYEKVMILNLPSHIGAVGNWILVKNTGIEYLFLEGDGSDNINLTETGKLRNLEFRNCSRVKKLVKAKDCKSGIVFPLLERLVLKNLENLEEICDGTIILKQNVSLSNLKSIQILGCSKLRYLFPASVARSCLLQLEVLEIRGCEAMEHVFKNEIKDDDTDGCIELPKLKILKLENLSNLTAFCQGIENVKFPKLIDLTIEELPKINGLCPLNSETPNQDRYSFHFLCNPKVETGGLEVLSLYDFGGNIKNIWCDQIPMNFFNNLQQLTISSMNGIRNLMPYSVAKKFVSLKLLNINSCKEMVEVIEDNDDDKEVVDIECLFFNLQTLKLDFLPKLRKFWQWNRALELPLLEEVDIAFCDVMETFTFGSLNTPKLKMWRINFVEIYDTKDLNDSIHQHFMTESQNTTMIEEEDNEIEDAKKDDDKDDYKIEYNIENLNKENEGEGERK